MLIRCVDCGHDVSSRAAACPHCGCPVTASEESARQEAAGQDSARREAARQEAARQEAARQEAARQETARRDSQKLTRELEARLSRKTVSVLCAHCGHLNEFAVGPAEDFKPCAGCKDVLRVPAFS